MVIIIDMTMFMVLSPWDSHGENSSGSSDECRTEPGAADPPINSCSVYTHYRPFSLLLLNSKADTHFTVPRRVEG